MVGAVQHLIPFDGTAGISRVSAHYTRERAFGDGLSLIERLAVSDARHQILVLLLVGIYFLVTEPIDHLLVARADPVLAIAGALRAHDSLLHLTFAAVH